MTLYDKIKNYLEKEEKDFNEGLELYSMASNHRSLMLYLQRKKNAQKLEYELSKLLKNLPSRLQKIVLPEVTPTVKEPANTDEESKEDKKEDQAGVKSDTTGDHKIIEFKKINPGDLPAEMKPLYDEISEGHKEMRSIHEKMKLAQTDEERAVLREKLIFIEDKVTAGWKMIDEFMLLKLQPKVEENKKDIPSSENNDASASDIAKEISAARTFLSRGIAEYKKAEESKKAGLKKKIEKRIKLLINNKASVSRKTKKALIDLAIISEKSELLAE